MKIPTLFLLSGILPGQLQRHGSEQIEGDTIERKATPTMQAHHGLRGVKNFIWKGKEELKTTD